MKAHYSRFILWFAISLIVIVVIAYSLWPRAIIADIGTLEKSELQISIAEEGKTRVHDVYVLSAPVTGYLRRIEAEVGDPVFLSSTTLAKIEPIDPDFLDSRTEVQARAAVDAAKSAQELSQATVQQAEAELEFALLEFQRMRQLRVNNSVSQRELEASERAYKISRAELATAQAAEQMRLFELKRAEALLVSPISTQSNHGECACIDLIAPINGRVLKVLNKNEGVVQAGTPLLEIGNPQDIEIIVELLSFDAVKVTPGQRVKISNWGGEQDLSGIVSLIEPIGFTKVSALGIEEQRVNVVIHLSSDASLWSRLGHGYQVDIDIILWEEEDILTLPITALFRDQNDWAVYAVVDGVIEKRVLKIGKKNQFHAQVLSGIDENEKFILYPNEQTVDGAKVTVRS